MMLASGGLTAFTAAHLVTGKPRVAAVGLGVALALYAVIGLTEVRIGVSARLELLLSPLAGAATGLVAGTTGILAVPSVPYLQALDLDRNDLVQALGLSFTVSTLALGAALVGPGVLGAAALGSSTLALIPALAGWLRRRIAARTFRRCFFVALFVLGLHLAV